MGSYASSVSNTNYTNTPITLTGTQNPLTLAGSSGNQVGGSGNVNGNLSTTLGTGASINTLDGGAIGSAFAFGKEAIAAIANLTKQNNEAQSANNAQALNFVGMQSAAAAKAIDKSGNAVPNSEALSAKTIWILGALGVLGAYFFMKRG